MENKKELLRWDSNPQCNSYEAEALPTELPSYKVNECCEMVNECCDMVTESYDIVTETCDIVTEVCDMVLSHVS